MVALSCKTHFTHKLQIVASRTDLLDKRTLAKKQDKRAGNAETFNVATWNVRGLCHKENILEKELKERKLDIAAISETKKKLKGSKQLTDYIMYYSGVEQEARASAGVALYIHNKWKNRIQSYCCVNERILIVRLKENRGYITIFAIYAPESGREGDSKIFYNELQEQIDKINKNDAIILAGDFNGRVGDTPIQNVVGSNGEKVKIKMENL